MLFLPEFGTHRLNKDIRYKSATQRLPPAGYKSRVHKKTGKPRSLLMFGYTTTAKAFLTFVISKSRNQHSLIGLLGTFYIEQVVLFLLFETEVVANINTKPARIRFAVAGGTNGSLR